MAGHLAAAYEHRVRGLAGWPGMEGQLVQTCRVQKVDRYYSTFKTERDGQAHPSTRRTHRTHRTQIVITVPRKHTLEAPAGLSNASGVFCDVSRPGSVVWWRP